MSRFTQRVPVGESDGPLVQWEKVAVGTIFEGKFLGLREGKYPDQPIADLETDDGPLALPAFTVLKRKLALVKIGADVGIEYRGMVKGKGHSYRDAQVWTGSAADQLPQEKPAASSKEIPF